MILYQHLRADNDRSGNPRRLFLVYDERGNPARVIDEGYGGSNWTYQMDEDLIQLPTINITPREYREWLAFGKERGILEYQ